MAENVLLSPIYNTPFIQDVDGNPLSGGKIFAYVGGSNTVLQDTYTTSAGTTKNANPIVLDSSGTLPNAIWLISGESYNLVLTDSAGTLLKGFDSVTGVATSGGGGSGSTAIWVTTAGATFLSSTSFLVTGNKTAEYRVGNRARMTLAGGAVFGTVTAVSFSSPNTTITVAMDAGTLNSSLSLAEYSVLIAAQGSTVDAGGVSYFDALPYATSNTVGWKINQVNSTLTTGLASTEAKRARMALVATAAGSGLNTAYTITPTPAVTSLATDQIFTVKFANASAGTATLTVNALSAVALKSYDYTGALVNVAITANQVSDVIYDGVQFVLLDVLPQAPAAGPPRGGVSYGTNSVFTTPAGVTTLRVTCVAGGGGGGYNYAGGEGYLPYPGGVGGQGAMTITYISTTPGTAYTVAIGVGGTGASTGSGATAGGNTSLGITLCLAGGGGPGGNASSSAAGTPGALGVSGTGTVLPGVLQFYGGGGAPEANGNSGYVMVEW